MNAWCINGDKESTAVDDITAAWNSLVQSFGDNLPPYMKREIDTHHKKKKTNEDEDNDEDQLHDDDEDFSNGSRDDQGENNFLQDLGMQGFICIAHFKHLADCWIMQWGDWYCH